MESEKVIIAIAGKALSGKTLAADFLVSRFSARHIRISRLLERLLDLLALENNQDNAKKLGSVLKEIYGDGVLMHALLDTTEHNDRALFVFDGIRNLEELNELKEHGQCTLIYIDASKEKRMERLSKEENSKGTEEDLQNFDRSQGDNFTESLKQYADFTINNDGTESELEHELTRCIIQSLD
jgi:dephospho-CoA kinase